jgi:hypothetical protein
MELNEKITSNRAIFISRIAWIKALRRESLIKSRKIEEF